VLTSALGLYRAGHPGLWRDELASWSASTRSVGALFSMLHHSDASNGAYYLGLHFWIAVFGDSPTAMRLPSVLAMAGAAGFVAFAGQRLWGTRAGVAGGVVFALTPSVSRYAQEARGYAFAVLGVSAATYLLIRAIQNPGRLIWVYYAVAVAISGAANLVALTFLTGHAVGVLLFYRREPAAGLVRRWPVAVCGGLVPLIPMMYAGRHQISVQIGWIPKPDLGSPFSTVGTVWSTIFGSYVAAAAVPLFAALACAFRRERWTAAVAAMATIPLFVVLVVSQFGTSYFVGRYLLFLLPASAMLAGAGLTALRSRWVGVAGIIAMAAVTLPDQREIRSAGSHDWWNYPRSPRPEAVSYSAAARVIARGYEAGDGVAYPPGQRFTMIQPGIAFYLPARDRLRDIFAIGTAAQAAGFEEPQTHNPTAVLAASRPARIWVVTQADARTAFATLESRHALALEHNYQVAVGTPVQGLTVWLLTGR